MRKDAGLCCGSRLRKGEVFAYVGLPQNLKDLKDGEAASEASPALCASVGQVMSLRELTNEGILDLARVLRGTPLSEQAGSHTRRHAPLRRSAISQTAVTQSFA